MIEVLVSILKVVNAVLVGYLLLLSIRIILTWFSGTERGKGYELLIRATDPYLSLFRRYKFLQKGMFDFTPLAAILVLVVLQYLVTVLIMEQTLTVGIVLYAVLSAAWRASSFIILLFLIVSVIRAVGVMSKTNQFSPLLKVVDVIVQPVVSFVSRKITLKGNVGYTQYLLLTIGLLFATWILGRVIIGYIAVALRSLPF